MGISAHSMVVMADGASKRAEDVAVDDTVFCPLSGDAIAILRSLNGPGVGMVSFTAGALRIDVTGDHRVLTDNGFMPAHGIRVGAKLQTTEGILDCTEAGPLTGDFMVYDFTANTDAPAAYVNGFVLALDATRR